MKNLIKINLNQTVSKAQMTLLKKKNRWIIFSSLCLLLVSIFIWFWFINFRLNYIISNRQVTINNKDTDALRRWKNKLSKTDVKL